MKDFIGATVTALEAVVGGPSAIIGVKAIGGWTGVAVFGVSLYAVTDAFMRVHNANMWGHSSGGLSEFLYRSPKIFYNRYRLWREIRAIDSVAEKGEVYV